MREHFNGQDVWERDIERSPMRYTENVCLNCGYRNRPSMSKDVCCSCTFGHKGRVNNKIYK